MTLMMQSSAYPELFHSNRADCEEMIVLNVFPSLLTTCGSAIIMDAYIGLVFTQGNVFTLVHEEHKNRKLWLLKLQQNWAVANWEWALRNPLPQQWLPSFIKPNSSCQACGVHGGEKQSRWSVVSFVLMLHSCHVIELQRAEWQKTFTWALMKRTKDMSTKSCHWGITSVSYSKIKIYTNCKQSVHPLV